MILSDWKTLFEIFQSIATIIGLAIGGYWVLYIFRRQRENYPHIEFTLDIKFHIKIGDWWVAELVANIENKGKVLHKLSDLKFKMESIESGNELDLSNDYGNQLFFPNFVAEGPFLSKDYNLFFIEPGTKKKFSYLTRIPAKTEVVLIHSWFYYDSNWSLPAEITKIVPKN